MDKLKPLLGLGSVTAKLFKSGITVHGETLARFAPLIALRDARLNKHIALLSSATREYLATGSFGAGNSAWQSIRALEGAINRLPLIEQDSATHHLERYVQMLLTNDAELALLIGKDIEKFRILRLRRLAERGLTQPSAESAVAGQWRAAAFKTGGDLLTIFKRFEKVVSMDSPAVAKASAYIRDNADRIREAVQAARAGNRQPLWGHLVNVRGSLGEAYALLSPVWRATHHRALQESKALARTMGPGYEALPLSQLENHIRLNVQEGADQMIVIINRQRREAITFLSAQVKTANISAAAEQTINDATKRELKTTGLLEFMYNDTHEALKLVQHELVTAQRYILNAALSRIPADDLARLYTYGAPVSEIILDMSVSQFSHLSIRMMEEGLNVVKKANPPDG